MSRDRVSSGSMTMWSEPKIQKRGAWCERSHAETRFDA
jgi:hypothetical protein